ncbi:hypothetical protein F9C07_2285764 [Aspergillus flavus]|uniref:Uncharacterized protein n=1 Tax=Aspergillus flavus (strain ATCC 200026 / FGSC A1120 / IAM 13836 / NRRL 3357 / JCM 12722 / SRRC 167) TaxID=332952 RepID=A0A7U2R3U3_ASPFN|nr:hypothetical protein F9C07_2285764 [Aspergillus flavus]
MSGMGILVGLRVDMQSKMTKKLEGLSNGDRKGAMTASKQWGKIICHWELEFKFGQVPGRHITQQSQDGVN